ncbi:HdeD family acid-resistance protein [Microvirga pudoricolor]|uniref:HdeD family acid-resistance protein n=1 Tax=Microvirga pudoricolor TaxID=2778729 RepID=UPI00194E2BF7|nr:HdeD family acid-resistance protein [Microvirga pudoricolor]MBM6593054.1 HdeD family acid-resistance protein [Microvirga pudoricolor]
MASGPTSPFPGLDRTAAMSELLAQNWWAVALRGLFAIVFALIAFFVPGATLLSFVLFFSAYMLVDGVFGIVAGIRAAQAHQRWGLLVLEGVVNILVGVIAFMWPGLTLVFFVTLMAFWSLITGVLMIVAAFKLDATYGKGWLIFSGVVSLLFGLALLIAPLVGAVVLTWWLGAYAMVFGIGLLVLAFKLKGRKDSAGPTAASRV